MASKKRDKGPTDSYAVFEVGIAYLGAADVLFSTSTQGPSPLVHLWFPSWTLAAFSAELLLKCLHHERTGSFPRTHELLTLVNALPVSDQQLLNRYCHETAKIDPLRGAMTAVGAEEPEMDLKSIATRCNRVFETFRYFYEHAIWPSDKNGAVLPSGVNHLLMALRRLLDERNPDWQNRGKHTEAGERIQTKSIPASGINPFDDPIVPCPEPAPRVESSLDPYLIYLHAHRFVDASQVLLSLIAHGSPFFTVPAQCLSAFTTELLLKCLVCDRMGRAASGHSLVALFQRLPPNDQAAIRERFDLTISRDEYRRAVRQEFKLARPDLELPSDDFDSTLQRCDHGFESLRYRFCGSDEWNSQTTDVTSDNLLEAVLRRIVTLHPEWVQRYAEAGIPGTAD